MGTRGSIGFHIDGQDKLTYNHWDSYPTGLGAAICIGLNSIFDNMSIEVLKEMARDMVLIDTEVPPTLEQKAKMKHFIKPNLEVSNRSEDDWYCLFRNMQGNLGEYLDCGFMPENNGFMFDSLFCEWAYVINLDTEKLEVYRGFNTVEGNAGRYASHLENAPFHREAKYYGVALIIEIPLSYFNSLSMADEEIEELMGDIEGIFYMRIENEDGEMVDDTRTAEERRVAFNEKYPSFTTYEMKEEEEEYA
jgi:hypothetical protein